MDVFIVILQTLAKAGHIKTYLIFSQRFCLNSLTSLSQLLLSRVMAGLCMLRKLFMINSFSFGKINPFFIVCFASLITEKL